MKGGRTAPRNGRPTTKIRYAHEGFNEGGADCPPKQITIGYEPVQRAASMKGGRTAPRNVSLSLC